MANETLSTVIRKLTEQALSNDIHVDHKSRGPAKNVGQNISVMAADVADTLALEAVASGYPLNNRSVETIGLSGGNTAELVAVLNFHTSFVYKLDQRNQKLAAEGTMMRNIQRSKLPERFKKAWPFIYAVRENPPYAYLMEYFPPEEGWVSLEERLYPKPGIVPSTDTDAVRLMHAILDILFAGYEASIDSRVLTSVAVDYVSRIKTRLTAAADIDTRFASEPISINGTQFEPWQDYLDLLERNEGFVGSISPPFSTVTHGDPNPGNLILRMDLAAIDVKLIDPKEWERGDYLFDIAKITHFLEATGPIEKPVDLLILNHVQSGGAVDLNYSFRLPGWTRLLVEACLGRAEQFALAHGDPHWAMRYELGMASNLLGLPEGRLKKGRHEAALALYGEGIRWLGKFCSRLRRDRSMAKGAAARVTTTEIEPKQIAEARSFVRAHAPEVQSAEDRRGFQLLHWNADRSNKNGKPAELSLEHEARLMPTSEVALQNLKRCLSVNADARAGHELVSKHSKFASLLIKRYERDIGFQSVDHYWDLKDSVKALRLIPRLLSLRERIKVSGFMSWTAPDEARPLNLELPLACLEETGVVVRLEFNWIDRLALALEDFRSGTQNRVSSNPIVLASGISPIDVGEFIPVVEHTTFREKYGLEDQVEGTNGSREIFQLNVDYVVAQSFMTGRIATYTDIDIAPSRKVDLAVLTSLIGLSQEIANRFGLIPINATKVWRDALLLGEL